MTADSDNRVVATGRPGGQRNNRNCLRHGLRSGKLPDDCEYIEWSLNAIRRRLEDAVLAARGEVGLLDAANIQTCIRWERHSALAQRWLRIKGGELAPMEQLKFSREIAKASTERDKALAALGLHIKPEPLSLKDYVVSKSNGNAS
jgi:hypothetical protein